MVEYLFCCASSASEPSLFFSDYRFGLGFKPVQDNLKHADGFVVLAKLFVGVSRE